MKKDGRKGNPEGLENQRDGQLATQKNTSKEERKKRSPEPQKIRGGNERTGQRSRGRKGGTIQQGRCE